MDRRLNFILFLELVVLVSCGKGPNASDVAPKSSKNLTVYCAANLKKPVEALAREYEKESGVQVSLQYGGTGTLLSQIQVAKKGDLFIAADEGSMRDAQTKNLVREVSPLVVQHPVLAVGKGNPKGIHSLQDLTKPEVKYALPNADAASIGRVSRSLLGAAWEGLMAKAVVVKPTVTDVAADVKLGAVDAGIVWDSTVPMFQPLEAVEIPELTKHRENASAGVLIASEQAGEAKRFVHYLTAPNKGGALFKQMGFTPAGGEKWAFVGGQDSARLAVQ